MSDDAKPYALVEAKALSQSHYGADPARVRATVEARGRAEAKHLRLRNYVQTTLDCSYGETGGGIHCPLETPCDKCKREKAEAERDEARAEVARLQDLHTRCAAFDDQPGPSCVTLAADAARLRMTLEKIEARCARISEETLEVFQLRHEIREVRLAARAALATDGEGT